MKNEYLLNVLTIVAMTLSINAMGQGSNTLYGFRFYLKDANAPKDFLGKILGLGGTRRINVLVYDHSAEKYELYSSHVQGSDKKSKLMAKGTSIYSRFNNNGSKYDRFSITEVEIPGKPSPASVKIAYPRSGNRDKKIGTFLKGVSADGNALTFKLWDYNSDSLPIKAPDATHPFAYDSSFVYVINWVTNHPKSTHPGYYFNLPFYTRYLVPISTPITYLVGNDSKNEHRWQSNFLTAGMAYGWARGRTQFFKNNQYTPRSLYVGAGFFAAVSANTIQAKDYNSIKGLPAANSPDYKSDTASNEFRTLTRLANGNALTGTYTAPLAQLGGHVGVCFGAVEIMGVYGWGWTFGYPAHDWAYQGKPFIGFGLGLSLFNLTVPGGI